MDAVNWEIQTRLYGREETAAYQWNVHNDILSLLIELPPASEKQKEYAVYLISVPERRRVSNDELLSAAGLSQTDYVEKARQAAGALYWNGTDRSDEKFQRNQVARIFNRQLQNTISQDNIDKAQPYFNMEGQLCAAVPIYNADTEAEYRWELLNLTEFAPMPDYDKELPLQTVPVNLTVEEATAIAYQYWNFKPLQTDEKTGALVDCAYIEPLEDPDSGRIYYFFKEYYIHTTQYGTYSSMIDELFIDSETGECLSVRPFPRVNK